MRKCPVHNDTRCYCYPLEEMPSIDERLKEIILSVWTEGMTHPEDKEIPDLALTEIKKAIIEMLLEEKAVGGQTKDCDIHPMEKLGWNAYRRAILTKLEGGNETT